MSRIIDIPAALQTLRPNSQWVHRGDTYEGIQWIDKVNEKPTKEEVLAEVERLQAEYDSVEYQRLRAKAYPSFADQFDILYHGGYDAWKASIEAIKNQFPKP
jgi:hypothetical protein